MVIFFKYILLYIAGERILVVLLVLLLVFVSCKLATLLFTFADFQAAGTTGKRSPKRFPFSSTVCASQKELSFWAKEHPEPRTIRTWHFVVLLACTAESAFGNKRLCERATQLYTLNVQCETARQCTEKDKYCHNNYKDTPVRAGVWTSGAVGH